MIRFPLLLCALILSWKAIAAMPTVHPLPEFPLKEGDRIVWHGSSSTMMGVWPRTVEFLLRTRHPELRLVFIEKGVGGGSFATALKKIDGVLENTQATVMFLNFGGNDATRGSAGLPSFRTNMKALVEKITAFPARPILLTPQPGEERMAGRRNDYLGLYAKELLATARAEGWWAIDVYQPLEELQYFTQNDIPDYTINKDLIHLTDSAYVAWGFFVYEALRPPEAESLAVLSADGKVISSKRCKISDVSHHDGRLSFQREDEVLPILPPNPIPVSKWTGPTLHMLSDPSPSATYAAEHGSQLPPRAHSPLEKLSPYLLKVEGLSAGKYAVTVDGKPAGQASAEQLAAGVNLNSLVLDAGVDAPWAKQALEFWEGKNSKKIGKTKFKFEIKRAE